MKRTKKFNQEWAEAIALLPYSLQYSATEAIRNYQNNGVVPVGVHPLVMGLFIVIRPTIDARARRSAYQKARRTCIKSKNTESSASLASADTPETVVAQDADNACGGEKSTVTIPSGGESAAPDTPAVAPAAPPRGCNNFLRQVAKARTANAVKHSGGYKNVGLRRK